MCLTIFCMVARVCLEEFLMTKFILSDVSMSMLNALETDIIFTIAFAPLVDASANDL